MALCLPGWFQARPGLGQLASCISQVLGSHIMVCMMCAWQHTVMLTLSCCHCLFLATLMSFKPLCQCQTYGGKEEFASSVFTSYTASSSCKLWGVGVPWGSSRNIQDYCNEKTAANSSKSLDFFIVLLANNLCCYSLCFCSWKNRVVLQILSDY